MRYGICAPPEDAAELAGVGFDYVEWPLRSTVGEMSSDEFMELRREAVNLPVVSEAWNVMLPATIKVVGPDADHATMASYLHTAFRRASELGGSVVVFGSGGSRRYPEGWSRKSAEEQLDEAFRKAGDVGREHGIQVVIEPLNSGETNLLNTVVEGAAAASRVDHPNVGLLADIFHIIKEGEDFADMTAAGPLLGHVHVSASDRTMPTDSAEEQLRDFFMALKRGGYDGRMSLECSRSSIPEAASSLILLRRIWDTTE